MEFNCHTYDIQEIVIALIAYKPDAVISEEDQQRLIDKLSEMNKLCTKENGYTINIVVNA